MLDVDFPVFMPLTVSPALPAIDTDSLDLAEVTWPADGSPGPPQ